MSELKRTCTRCGREWYVPTDAAPPRKQAKAVGWFTPIVGKKRQAIRAEQALVDMQNAQSVDATRCRECGSGEYSEVLV